MKYLHMLWRVPVAIIGTIFMTLATLAMMIVLFCLGFAEGFLGLGDFCFMACSELPGESSEQVREMWEWSFGAAQYT